MHFAAVLHENAVIEMFQPHYNLSDYDALLFLSVPANALM